MPSRSFIAARPCLRILFALGMACALNVASSLPAQVVEDRPAGIEGVGIDAKLGEQIPLDLKFQDESGKVISLRDIFDGDRPVLLSLNYSDCPMLCGVQLNGLVSCLKQMKWTTGVEYDMLSVSIDPRELPSRAKQTEQKYLNDYGRPGVGDGWHFLVGQDENIKKLADAVGFRYKFVPATGEYSHTAATMVITPDGVVSRYLYGVMYDPQTTRLSLVEAADGKVGSPMDQILLFCFHYDETTGRYGPAARRVMSIGAVITMLALAVGLVPFWLHKKNSGNPTTNDATLIDAK